MARRHLAADLVFRKFRIAQNVDLANLGLGAFGHFEHDIDAILFEQYDLGLDRGRKAPRTAIEFENAPDIGTRLAAREDLARRKTDFLADLVFLDPLCAFDDDPVDHRIFLYLDGERTIFVADRRISEQFRCEQRLQRLVGPVPVITVADVQIEIGSHRFSLEPFGAADQHRAYDAGIGGCGRQRAFGTRGGGGGFGFSRWRRWRRIRTRRTLRERRPRQHR